MDILQYHSIKWALKNSKIYDFEGSMIRGIELYFRSFGARQIPYFEISKVNSKFYQIIDFIKNIFC